MNQIFGDVAVTPSLSTPMEWGAPSSSPTRLADECAPGPNMPSGCKRTCAKRIKYSTDDTYLVQCALTMKTAVSKWRFILLTHHQHSEVGKQIATQGDEDLISQSVIGVKSPNTMLKGANSILMYFRRQAVHGEGSFIPFNETDVWNYVLAQHDVITSASRSQTFLQALRFSHYVMGIDGALECTQSRRVMGQAHLQLSKKQPTKQARALSASEVKRLHAISEDRTFSIVDRCIASNILMALYGRCRVSELNHVQEMIHDTSCLG